MTYLPEDLRAAAGNKQILVYGAGNQGRGIILPLIREGFLPAGFIDRNPDLQNHTVAGLPVYSPEYLMKQNTPDVYFIIIASFFFEHEIAEKLESHGFSRGSSYLPYSTLKPRDYVIEVSGVCNLRCISCPRADSLSLTRPAAMMTFDDFKNVLAKIRREDPFVGNIQLYQWGEPTLNRNLPAMIRHARENGILCGISSNLNHPADFRSLLEAHPECLRISASGVDSAYEATHTGGNWKTFIANVETVARLRREIYPEMKIELYYHRYKHSVGKPQEQIEQLCHKAGFEFHPVPAYLISLDDVLGYCQGGQLPQAAQKAREMLLIDLDKGLEYAAEEAHLECDALRVIMINADISVSACMMYYYPERNTIADNFLETPLAQIVKRRNSMELCMRCKKYGIHRYCGVYAKMSGDERF